MYAWNCAHALMCARQWENLIMADNKLLKQDFDLYYHLLHKTSIVNYKIQNFTNTCLLYSVLNSRAFDIDYIKIEFYFYQISI